MSPRAAPSRPRAPALLAALLLPLALSACILDLSGLSEPAPTGGSGGGGATTSGATTAPSACSALSCGACEEPCPEGGCLPVVIANGPDVAAPLGLAVAQGALYWVDEALGTVMRLRDDGSPPAAIATGADKPRTVAAGPGLVVWSASDGVWACPPETCDADKKKLWASIAPSSVREVAYDGQTVFWTDRGTTQYALDGQVLRCSPEDCQPAAIATGQWAPTGLVLLDDTLLWTTQAGPYEDGRVMKAEKLAALGAEITAGRRQPTGLAADDLRVYWSEYNPAGKVLSCPHTTGYCSTPADVAPALGPLGYPRDVAIAGGRVYFTTTEPDGAVRSCPTPGCAPGESPRIHAAARPGLRRMAAGATCLFFTDGSNGGSVVKVGR